MPHVRAFIRHATEFPIELVESEAPERQSHPQLRDVSEGGLCCHAPREYTPGESVRVRIPLPDRVFEADGRIAWCQSESSDYRVGIEFLAPEEAFRARMVEQICHIEQYRRAVRAEGRELSSDEAAQEWMSIAQAFAGPATDTRAPA